MTPTDDRRQGREPVDGPPTTARPLLQVRDLSVVYEPAGAASVQAVRHATFDVQQGEFVGLVGESGSGKSTLGFAVTRLQRPPARTNGGEIIFDGQDIRLLDQETLRRQRQGGFAMVMQAGMNALNPVRSLRRHFVDIFKAHGHIAKADWEERQTDLIRRVGLEPAALSRYPGELSGGMRQRAVIALALSLEPRLMVFDEPTTALDVLVQHEVMETIKELQRSEGFTAILISHDLGIVLEATERVLVMHEGEIVEDASNQDILARPRDAYTKMLLSHYADPRAEVIELPGFGRAELDDHDKANTAGTPPVQPSHQAIVIDDVSKIYPRPRRGEPEVHAVSNASFRLDPGQSLALVGQSGSGKSTLAKMITGVERPTSGSITFGEVDIAGLNSRGARALRSSVQMIFQDPYAALNPLHTVEHILSRPIHNYTELRGDAARERIAELLETVGLTPISQFASKLPHQLSGGQRQRVVIARALASNPQVLVADEPVSMLDVTLRAGVLGLLRDLRLQHGISLLYITHDLLSARLVTDDILVLHDGRIVERGRTADVLRNPKDDYTIRLLDAIPNPAAQLAG